MNDLAVFGLAIAAALLLALLGLFFMGFFNFATEATDGKPMHPREEGACAALSDWKHGTTTTNPYERGGLDFSSWAKGYDDFYTALIAHTADMPLPI
ncbi:hypothetical protein D9M73_116600 [compost metagenome]